MIVDVHCHLYDRTVPSKAYWNAFVKVTAALSGRSEERVWERAPGWWDLSGDMLVGDMDEAGIDKAVVLPMDALLLTDPDESVILEQLTKIFVDAARRHPDRIIAFVGIDPRRRGTAKFLEKAVKEYGVKGLKLHPAFGFYPNDKYCYLLYEKAEELEIPVLVHSGPEIYPFYSKYARPVYLDDVANDFPELKLIVAHAGSAWFEEAIGVANNKLNMYLDVSWWQPRLLQNPIEEFYKPLRRLTDAVGSQKVLFGSDWPGFRLLRRLPHKAWVKAFTEIPPEVAKAGINFKEEEIENIMGRNAARLLKLTE